MKKILFLFGAGLILVSPNNLLATEKLSDVGGSVHKEAIYYLFGEGVVGGYDDGTFRPQKSINRAEFLKIIIQSRYADELKDRNYNQRCFDDISDKNAWYVPYACFAQDWGFISGYDGKYLRPTQEINIVEAAKIISGIYGKNKITLKDSEIWYRPYMKYMFQNRFMPPHITSFSHTLSRSEMAEIITRAEKQRFGKLEGYLDFRKDKYQEDYFPTWEEFNNRALGKEVTPIVGESAVPQKIVEVITTVHPGQKISGGYISDYNQWTPARYSANINNNTITAAEVEAFRTSLLSLVNDERQKENKGKLISHGVLNHVSQNFAEHLVVNGFYSHSDKYGNDPFERAKAAGYTDWVSESMVWNNSGVSSAINWWKKSSLHWNNIMNVRYNHAGIGVVKEPNGGYIFILMTGE